MLLKGGTGTEKGIVSFAWEVGEEEHCPVEDIVGPQSMNRSRSGEQGRTGGGDDAENLMEAWETVSQYRYGAYRGSVWVTH